jgi:hypothetical protein
MYTNYVRNLPSSVRVKNPQTWGRNEAFGLSWTVIDNDRVSRTSAYSDSHL